MSQTDESTRLGADARWAACGIEMQTKDVGRARRQKKDHPSLHSSKHSEHIFTSANLARYTLLVIMVSLVLATACGLATNILLGYL